MFNKNLFLNIFFKLKSANPNQQDWLWLGSMVKLVGLGRTRVKVRVRTRVRDRVRVYL